jgi:hypothetical protein
MRARRARARGMRRKVVALSVTAFLAVWGVVYVQMVEGKDPALSTTTTKHVAKTNTASNSPSSNSQSSAASSTPTPVTTSQS